MPSPESHPFDRITKLADEADAALAEGAASGDLSVVDQKLDALEAEVVAAERRFNPFEQMLNLSAQYESQTKLLETLGIPETLNRQSRPTLDQVRERFLAKRELLEQKIEQGFTKLLIVPFGMSIAEMAQIYGGQLKKHQAANRLFAEDDPATPLELDTATPVWRWDGYDKEEMVYFPTAFDRQNHGGLTKEQAIAKEGAWQVYLVEETPIPRQTKGKTKGGRNQLEANLTPNQYLEELKTDPSYQGEGGLTPETWLMKALTRLEEKNEVIDDYQGKGYFNYNLGAYFPKSAGVAGAFWARDRRQADMGGYDAGGHDPYVCASFAVRV